MQTANTQALRSYAQDADVAETPRFENGFPYPLPGDPEPVFVNAAFMVIAEPRNRKVLELLRLMPMTEAELRDFVHLGDFERGASLHDLMATGLVRASGEKRERFYSLDRQGFSAFELWPQGPSWICRAALDRFAGEIDKPEPAGPFLDQQKGARQVPTIQSLECRQ